MLCLLSYRRIYRNEDGEGSLSLDPRSDRKPNQLYFTIPTQRSALDESGGISSSVAALMRLRRALIRFCGHDRVGDQVDRKGEHLRDEPDRSARKLVKIHSITRPFSVIFADSGFRPRDLTNMACALFLTELCPHLGCPLQNCTGATRIRMRRFYAASGRLPGADRLYNRKEAMERGRRGVGTIARRRPGAPVCLPHTRGRV